MAIISLLLSLAFGFPTGGTSTTTDSTLNKMY